MGFAIKYSVLFLFSFALAFVSASLQVLGFGKSKDIRIQLIYILVCSTSLPYSKIRSSEIDQGCAP